MQVAWSRAEEFFFDTFRPAAVVTIDAGLGEGGRITDWDYTTYFAGSRGAEQFYEIPNHRTVASPNSWRGGPGTHPFATGAWRAPGNNTNTFARESHIDALAAAAGTDPVEFRRRHLADAKMRRVLDATAERFGWKPAPAPSGRGQGIALGIDAGTFVGLAVEVAVDRSTGEVRVTRMVCAQDMGLAINPEGAVIQMEGCLMMGLGYALTEEVRFEGGKVLDTNFDTYEIPRFSWLPEIDTVILDAANDPPQGGGEPAIVASARPSQHFRCRRPARSCDAAQPTSTVDAEGRGRLAMSGTDLDLVTGDRIFVPDLHGTRPLEVLGDGTVRRGRVAPGRADNVVDLLERYSP